MGNLFKIIVAIIAVILAFKILKGVIGLLVGLAIAGVIFFGATKLLEKK